MGLQLWWASEGIRARTEACKEGNRCGVYTSKDKVDTGKAPKCAHCNERCARINITGRRARTRVRATSARLRPQHWPRPAPQSPGPSDQA